MIVAGVGFRTSATLAGKSKGLEPLAEVLGLPLLALEPEALRGQVTQTQSGRVDAMFGTGSVAEAAALVAAGPGARLRGPRAVSADGTATTAIAEGEG